MRPLTLLYYAIVGVLLFLAWRVSSDRPESIVYGLIMGVVLVFAISRLSGQPLSAGWLRRPTIWDVLGLVFILSVPFVAGLIGDALVAGVVLVAAGIALFWAERRFGRPRAEPVS